MTKIEERLITGLDECLAAIEAGDTIESCLARHPDELKELAPLLQIALALQSLPHPGPSPAMRRTAKHQFLTETERRRALTKRNLGRWFSQRFSSLAWAGPVRTLVTVGITLALILVIGGSVIYAAGDSLPGDSLYGVKRLSEEVRYALTFRDSSRIRLEDAFAERRRVEVHHLLTGRQNEEVIFGGVLRERSEGVWWVEDIPVTVNADTLVQTEPPTNTFVEIHGITQADGTVLASLVEIEGDEVIGLVEVIGRDDWQIAGKRIQVDNRTYIEDQLQVGDCVEVYARHFPDGTLLALEIEQTEKCYEDDSDKDQDDDVDEQAATPTMQPSPGSTSPPLTPPPAPTDEDEDQDEEEMEEKEIAPTMQPSPAPVSSPPDASSTPTDDEGDEGDDSDQDDDANGDIGNGDDSDQDDSDDADSDKDNGDDSDQDDDDDANGDKDNSDDSSKDDSDDGSDDEGKTY